MTWLFEPGFFSSATVHTELVVGALVAIVASLVGVFVVVRSQSFAGHALTDVATAGGAGSFLVGATPLVGFVGGGLIGAGAMEAIGVDRVRDRDVATGIVLGAATGCSALFLYLASTQSATTGVTQQVLFGSIVSVSRTIAEAVVVLGAIVLIALGASLRPLVLSSVSADLARARGINTRLVGGMFIVTMALAVAMASVVIGSILSTALLIGPPAAALRVTRRVASSLALAGVLAVASTWLGVLFAYDSPEWSSSHRALPVSFFIVVLIVLSYLLTSSWSRWSSRHSVTD